MPGSLYSVALPIGNSHDLTDRAKTVLSTCDFIACEDTRKLKDLLKRAEIHTNAKFYIYNAFNEKNSASGLIELLKRGEKGALVSDAGTPRLSDPGIILLKLCYAEKIPVVPVPGASALTALVSVCPFSVDPLLFLGFLSNKSARRQNELKKHLLFDGTLAVYESVHRIEQTLADVAIIFPNAPLLIGREITKDYEEFFLGTTESVMLWVKGKKGEFALMWKNSPKG